MRTRNGTNRRGQNVKPHLSLFLSFRRRRRANSNKAIYTTKTGFSYYYYYYVCNACACSVVCSRWTAAGQRHDGEILFENLGGKTIARTKTVCFITIFYTTLYERVRHVKTIYYINVKKKKTTRRRRTRCGEGGSGWKKPLLLSRNTQ